MRRWIALCLLTAACSFGSSEEEGKDKDSKPPEPVAVVEVVRAENGEVIDQLVASASVEAVASADLMTEAQGRVVSVHKDVGDPVDRGTLLAVVENTSLDAGADRAGDEVQHLEARYTELQALHERGAVSDRELADAAYALRTARTSLREARAREGETRITAPFEGVVASRDVRVGQYLAVGQRAFQVVDLSELRVVAALPERDLGRVEVGQEAVLVSSYDSDAEARAVVTRIAPVVDAMSGTFQVTLTLDADQQALRPGQYVSARIEVDRREDVLVVPKSAVLYEGGRPYVFVMTDAPPAEEEEESQDDADEASVDAEEADAPEQPEDEGPRFVAERHDVVLGLSDERLAEVDEGLSEGDKVIITGHTTLRDGARVREPVPESASAQGVDAGEDDEG